MNRHYRRQLEALRRRARDSFNDPAKRDDYNRGAEKHFQFFRYMLTKLPPEDPPRFALLSKDVGLFASLDDFGLGRKLARNYTAEIMINALLMFAQAEGLEPPTYMMLRAFIEETGLATDTIEFHELGLDVKLIAEGDA